MVKSVFLAKLKDPTLMAVSVSLGDVLTYCCVEYYIKLTRVLDCCFSRIGNKGKFRVYLEVSLFISKQRSMTRTRDT